jgi:hypothetical protein
MNKILTVISLLFIVAHANCTKKVSYSEIVSSLAQVQHVEGVDGLFATTESSWDESLSKLNAFKIAITNQCKGITARGEAKATNSADNIKSTVQIITDLGADNVKLSEEIKEAVAAQSGNQENAANLKEELVNDAGVLQDKTMAIVERARVLRRLSNLVQDELVGAQRDSTVGDFKVDKKASGFSFVEVHNQLKELNSHDPIVKSMITTLVLITQDKKNLFANQEQVGKIAAMIDEIIKKDAAAGLKLRTDAAEKATEIHKSLSELSEDMMVQMNVIAEKRATIVQHNNIISFSKAEKISMEAAAARASKRHSNNMAMCTKVQAHNKLVRGDFASGASRFEELKKLVA